MPGSGNGTPLDYGELERSTRVGYDRGMAMRPGECKRSQAEPAQIVKLRYVKG